MRIYLLADIGSTYTKVTAVDVDSKRIIGFDKSFTTIQTDVRECYNEAVKGVLSQIGSVEIASRISASSAAGGLKMVSSGLVPDLTSKASKLAAASAGAKVVKTYAYELTQFEVEEILDIKPDIMLLSGGIDGGNAKVLMKNAQTIADIPSNFAVIIAGNRSCAHDAQKLLVASGKNAIICENVMPSFGKLNIEPAKNAIRDLFIENIIFAKGLDKLAEMMDDEIIPTPLAVYEALHLLSKGTKTQGGLGELMAYDLGGATTDVYSMADGAPKRANAYISGIAEPFGKRTVEGDIGMRYSQSALHGLIDEEGEESFLAEYGIDKNDLESWLSLCKESPAILPSGEFDKYQKVDSALATEAIRLSAARHVGENQQVFTPGGEMFVQTGKDLTQVSYIIGSGGAIINAPNPAAIMQKAIYHPKDMYLLKPLRAKILIDQDNAAAAMGLLSRRHPDVALAIMKDRFVEVV